MKITKETLKEIILAELTNFDRNTGRPQTEKGRHVAAADPSNEKEFLDDEERGSLDDMIAVYGSYTNIPKRFKEQFKESMQDQHVLHKGTTTSMKITKKHLKYMILEELQHLKEATGHLPHDEKAQVPDLFRVAEDLRAIAQNTFNSENAEVLRQAAEILHVESGVFEGTTKAQADKGRSEGEDARRKREGEPARGKDLVSKADLKRMMKKGQGKK